jgi:hypothetical protein
LFSLPQGTEMFQFPWFPLLALCVQARVTPHDGCRVSPFGYLRIDARSTAPRSFSQSPTSFIGSRRQGIHRWLFVAWNQRCSCSLWSSQGAGAGVEAAGGPPLGPHNARAEAEGSSSRESAAADGRSASCAGCPFKTEQKVPGLTLAHGRRKSTCDGRAGLRLE